MKVRLNRGTQPQAIPTGSLYVSQDNYEIVDLKDNSGKLKYLYCDSATSCIIVIVSGKNKAGNSQVAITHLSRPERFERFWELVEENFTGEICVFAHGANPPEPGCKDGKADYTALRNTGLVNKWILDHSLAVVESPQPAVKQATLLFGEGNPSDYNSNLDCYGIDISDPENLTVSNKRLDLTIEDRDPTGGLQSLFCPYGLKLQPPMVLIRSGEAIDTLHGREKELLELAHADDYERYASMKDEQILQECSSTPDAEVPWFCDTIRTAAQYVIDHYNK